MGGKETKIVCDDSCPNQRQSQSSPGGLGGATGVEGQRDGKFRKGKLYCVCCRVNVGECNMCVGACTCKSVHVQCTCKCNNVHSCMDTCTVLCAKRVENGFLHTLGIISVILHAIHTQDIST